MKRVFLAVVLLLGTLPVRAETKAVQATNFLIGFTTGDTYLSGKRTSNFFDINGDVTFPLAPYLGASLSAGYGNSNLATNPFPGSGSSGAWPSCTVRNESLEADLFLRDPGLGRVGVGRGRGALKSRCNATFLSTGSDSLTTDDVTARAEYYFPAVTLGVARGKVSLEAGAELDSETLTVGWYPGKNALITFSADGLDFENTYRLGLEFQPVIIDNALSLFVGYVTQRKDVTSHTIVFGFNYFYEKRIDLITRDRRYR